MSRVRVWEGSHVIMADMKSISVSPLEQTAVISFMGVREGRVMEKRG